MAARTARMWAAGTTASALLAVSLVAAGTTAGAETTRPRPQPTLTATEEVRYGQTTLYTTNVDTLLNFYRDALGFTVLYRFPETGPAVFGTVLLGPNYYITFTTYDTVRQATGIAGIGRSKVHQSEVVVLTPDVDALFARAQKARARVLMPPKEQPWGERSAYVADPEGNFVQISTHRQ
ncbi:VOC family protein [Streptomyces lunaelactis]|uniref:VOC family protein n=1 Tax=Streptomyces lunaelactis TaxID=1535768 RepID=UPI001584C67C|nr:VOC family protein [Streptomyces lunaelactis]NUK21447.1 VOC family protein [Streptomyces lunaelactis]